MKRALGAVAAALALTGCGSTITVVLPSGAPSTTAASAPATPGSSPSSSSLSSSPSPTTETVSGMPAAVRQRLNASGVFELVADTPDLTWKTLNNVVVVGNSPTWVDEVAQAAERRVAPLAALTDQPVKGSYLFLVPANDDTAKDWDPGDVSTRDFDGVSIPGFRETDPNYIIIMAQHTFDDGSSITTDRDYLDSLVQHEMFHASTLVDGAGSSDTPEWVIEGFAEWAGQNVTAAKPSKMPPARLPDDDEVLDDKDDGYFRAFMFVRYLVQTYGKDKALAFYRTAVEPDQENVPAAFRSEFGVSLARATELWKSQFAQQFRGYDADYEYDN